MPFTSLPSRNVGDPVFANDNVLVKDNFDDHEARISQLETNDKRIIVFNDVVLNAAAFTTLTGLDLFKSIQTFTLTECVISIFEAGSFTGVLEVDVKKGSSLDPGTFGSVFTTKPSIDLGTAVDYDNSTNAVFDIANKDVSTDEYLRLDITGIPSGGIIPKFFIILKGEI